MPLLKTGYAFLLSELVAFYSSKKQTRSLLKITLYTVKNYKVK